MQGMQTDIVGAERNNVQLLGPIGRIGREK